MIVVNTAVRACSAARVHAEDSHVVYALCQHTNVAWRGKPGFIVVGFHPHVVALGCKDVLARHTASASLRPATLVGPAVLTFAADGATTSGGLDVRDSVVLKPCRSSCGAGVKRVPAPPGGGSVDVPADCVAQAHVQCAEVRGHKADVRLWMCVDGRGVAEAWVAPSALVRVVRCPTLFCTNTAAAPVDLPCLDFEDARDTFYAPAAALARAFARALVPELAAAPAPPWTLLGIDVAVDRAGKPWLLEVNALPYHDTADATWGPMYAAWLRSLAAHLEAVAAVDARAAGPAQDAADTAVSA